MGLKEIFRKEEGYLASPKDLPDLASEIMNDAQGLKVVSQEEKQEPKIVPQSIPENATPEVPRPEPVVQQVPQTNSQQVVHQALQQPIQQVPQQFHYLPPQNVVPHHPFLGYPQVNPYYYSGMAQVNPHTLYPSLGIDQVKTPEIVNSERRPLMKLLAELDALETRWHSLTNKKTNLEKEIKYLESDIEHKMKLLRTHLAIANEENEVSEGDEFHLADGQILRTRADLEFAAKEMSKQIFDHHVGPGWNDFEAWVANCLHDYSLAKKLKNISSPNHLVSALKKY